MKNAIIIVILAYLIFTPPGFCGNHPVDLYVTQDFSYSDQEINRRMSFYVNDLNKILAKNTSQRLYLTGVIYRRDASPTQTSPPGGFSQNQDFKVNFSIKKLQWGQSSGYPTWNSNDDVYIDELTFRDIYDVFAPDFVSNYWQNYDYGLQLHILIHEFAHFFGTAIGEYYNGWAHSDATGIYPVLPQIGALNHDDVFWRRDRPYYLQDPMLTFGFSFPGVYSRKDYTDFVQFSPLSAAILNRGLRFPTYDVPVASKIRIRVLRGNAPVANARVRLFVHSNILIGQYNTDSSGYILLNNFLNSSTQIAIVKVEHGFVGVASSYISHWDMQSYGMSGSVIADFEVRY